MGVLKYTSYILIYGIVATFLGIFIAPICGSENIVRNSFEKVLGDVIEEAPTKELNVRFPSGSKARYGNELSLFQTNAAPIVSWKTEPTYYYTLIMIDPDAPSRTSPSRRHWLHWLVGNIDPKRGMQKADVLADYNRPTPPKGTGAHRYIFLVYKNHGKIQFGEKWGPNDGYKRGGFDLAKFTAKYQLGDPVAGNFFLTTNE